MGERATVTILGARGSVPVSGKQFSRYGGATSCVLVRMGGQSILLDAGTGLMDLLSFLAPEENELTLLLTHPHIDHMMGFPACPVLFQRHRALTFMGAARRESSVLDQVLTLMAPPLWPVGPEAFLAHVRFFDFESHAFSLGPVKVTTMEGCHPGGCTVFRLTCDHISLVYATDYELTPASTPRLAEFARDCSLLLCDGQYTRAEYETKRGFGHSPWESMAELARACGAKALRIFHHDPDRTDQALDDFSGELERLFPGGQFATCAEEIVLT